MKVWRLVHRRYAETAFSGEGASQLGGRFNSPGRFVVYTSGSFSLALLEMLAQVGSPERLVDFVYVNAEFDPALVTRLDSPFPEGWNAIPPGPVSQSLGDRWLGDETSAVLEVPSVLVPFESNFLINPLHSDARSIAIGRVQPAPLDPRILNIG